MKLFYGANGVYSDVTTLAWQHFFNQGEIVIPAGDCARANKLGDPLFGVVKDIKHIDDAWQEHHYPADQEVRIAVPNIRTSWKQVQGQFQTPEEALSWIHQRICQPFGSLIQEYPEQLMTMKYLEPTATVLELGANIGRNTAVIATLLNDDHRFVSFECDPVIAQQLSEVKQLNSLNFHIESAALSHRPLCQNGWQTMPYDGQTLPAGYQKVTTLTVEQLRAKYDLSFDTLVADCEGALFYILQDTPSLLNGITTVILENDFASVEHKTFVDRLLTQHGLEYVYTAPNIFAPCLALAPIFFQVFKKKE